MKSDAPVSVLPHDLVYHEGCVESLVVARRAAELQVTVFTAIIPGCTMFKTCYPTPLCSLSLAASHQCCSQRDVCQVRYCLSATVWLHLSSYPALWQPVPGIVYCDLALSA